MSVSYFMLLKSQTEQITVDLNLTLNNSSINEEVFGFWFLEVSTSDESSLLIFLAESKSR